MTGVQTCDLSFFFFPSRKRHTIYWRDWSSAVCSSDLGDGPPAEHLVPLTVVSVPDHRRGQPDEQILVARLEGVQIGKASCRERVQISVFAVSLKKKLQYRQIVV